MGRVKKAIHETLGDEVAVSVDYKRCVVRLQREIVVRYDDLGTLVLTGAAWHCRETVEHHVNAMKAGGEAEL